jgi:SAM-dependent methyltransferase
MSFISKLRTVNSLANTNSSAAAVRPAYGRDTRVAPVPLHAPASRPARAGEETSGRFSNGLKEFLWQIEDIGRGSLLDLGAVSQATVTYFIERNFKVYTEDLLAAWGTFLEQDSRRAASSSAGADDTDNLPAARADRFLASNLRYPVDSFDAVLLWDVLDYMDREAAQRFLARITSLVRDGGAVLAIFHTRPPEEFQRYRVLDAHNLELVSVPTLVQPRHVYQNREIQELFEKFRTSKTFVGRDQLREGVFVK